MATVVNKANTYPLYSNVDPSYPTFVRNGIQTYKAPFAGSVTRYRDSKIAESVSVSDFGAVGTNTGDQSAAFQRAINTGYNVLVPKGDYRFTAGVTMQTRGQRMVFEQGSRVLPVGSFDLITLTGAVEHMGISGMYCHGGGMTGGNVIAVKTADRVQIDDILMITPWNGIYIEKSNVCRLTRFYIYGAKGAYCIQWYGDASKRSDVLAIYESELSSTAGKVATGLLWDGNCNTLRVQGLSMVNCSYGVQVLNTSGGPVPQFGLFDDLEVDFAANDAVRIEAGQHFWFTPLLYLHGSIAGSGLYVAAAVPADHVHVSGGKITSHARYGVENSPRARLSSVFFSGNTLGNMSGAGMLESQKFQVDSTGYFTLQTGNPLIGYDSGDYRTFNRSTNTESLVINSIGVERATDTTREMLLPLRLAGYTFATVPSASTYTGYSIRVTDRSHRTATSDGTNWRWGDNTIIS